MVDRGLVLAYDLAPVGAQCRMPGFEMWFRALGGWRNAESGVTLESADLAARVEEAGRISVDAAPEET